MAESLYQLRVFFERGGDLLWVILALSVLLWALILERYWYFYLVLPQFKDRVYRRWLRQIAELPAEGSAPWLLPRLRDSYVADFAIRLRRYLPLMRALTTALPLLGLLGTVTGMIKTFEVITVFGSGNVRGMAAGLSEALLTTMAGLVTALSGLYLVASLDARADQEIQKISHRLRACETIPPTAAGPLISGHGELATLSTIGAPAPCQTRPGTPSLRAGHFHKR